MWELWIEAASSGVSHCDVDSHFKQNFEMTSSGINALRVNGVSIHVKVNSVRLV